MVAVLVVGVVHSAGRWISDTESFAQLIVGTETTVLWISGAADVVGMFIFEEEVEEKKEEEEEGAEKGEKETREEVDEDEVGQEEIGEEQETQMGVISKGEEGFVGDNDNGSLSKSDWANRCGLCGSCCCCCWT